MTGLVIGIVVLLILMAAVFLAVVTAALGEMDRVISEDDL